jgi:hypothetical protein
MNLSKKAGRDAQITSLIPYNVLRKQKNQTTVSVFIPTTNAVEYYSQLFGNILC